MTLEPLPPVRLGLLLRVAFTVVLVYAVHFAPNVVRETYLAVAIAERGSIRVDPFLGLHPDLFEIPGRGAFINNNPGASMIGAIPYAIVRPFLEIVYWLRPGLVAPKPPASYDDPRPNRTRFMNEMRARGLDVRLALAAAIIQVGLNAPLGALATVLVFLYLRDRLQHERYALYSALLFAFGTPMFFRSAFLNQNLLLAYCTLFAFLLLVWRRANGECSASRTAAAGWLLGIGLLCDYSALPLLAAFGLWLLVVGYLGTGTVTGAARAGSWFAAGLAGPVLLLLVYQYVAFGNFLLPAQAYMPSTSLSVGGWNGVRPPQPDLLWRNLFDPGYGLFVFCPLMFLACLAPFFRHQPGALRSRDLVLVGMAVGALYLFSSSIAFAALQWNTGVRYLVPAVPLLFLALVPVLLGLPRILMWSIVVPTVTISWAVSMARENVPVSLLRVFTLGVELPWHTVLQKTAEAYMPALASGGFPAALFVVVAVVLYLVWKPRSSRRLLRHTMKV